MDKSPSFQKNPENIFDTEARRNSLEEAAESFETKKGEEKRLGIPTYDESMVMDYIRNRIEPPQGLESRRVEIAEMSRKLYDRDLKQLRALSKDQINELLSSILEKSSGHWDKSSKGNLIQGYAIDSETLKSLQRVYHHNVDSELAVQIGEELKAKGIITDFSLHKMLKTIVCGDVYLKVPGFHTPIVRLWSGSHTEGPEIPHEIMERIVKHIIYERKLLPVSENCEAY